jgi:hypothetical protein
VKKELDFKTLFELTRGLKGLLHQPKICLVGPMYTCTVLTCSKVCCASRTYVLILDSFLSDIELLRQFWDEMEGLNSWLQEVEAFLQAEEDLPVGDVETLEAQLEQSNVSSS